MSENILIALIGVGATIAGTILGWALNNISNKGKLNFYIKSWKKSFKYCEEHFLYDSPSAEKTQCYVYCLSIEIYNSSNNTKIMRDIKLSFYDKKNELIYDIPLDTDTEILCSPKAHYDKVGPINISAKKIKTLNLHNEIYNKKGLPSYIWNTKNIYLVYINEKSKKKKILIESEDYSKHFFDNIQEDNENG